MNIGTTPTQPRTADPLVACIGELAARFGVAFAPGLLSGLALDRSGRLPWHQASPALELLGLNTITEDRAKLMRRPEPYPAMVSLGDGPVVIHEVRDRQALVWRPGTGPGTGTAAWEPFPDLAAAFTGQALSVTGDPQALRDASQPWHKRAREHWFWSEIARDRRKFTPVLVATFIVNLLALAQRLRIAGDRQRMAGKVLGDIGERLPRRGARLGTPDQRLALADLVDHHRAIAQRNHRRIRLGPPHQPGAVLGDRIEPEQFERRRGLVPRQSACPIERQPRQQPRRERHPEPRRQLADTGDQRIGGAGFWRGGLDVQMFVQNTPDRAGTLPDKRFGSHAINR